MIAVFRFFDIYNRNKRALSEPSHLRKEIESWGGKVIQQRAIGRPTEAPFPNTRVFPILYEFRVDHEGRKGIWYVRTSNDDGPPDWAWFNLDHKDSLPIDHPNAVVINEPITISRNPSWLIVAVMIIVIGIVVSLAVTIVMG